MPNPLNLVTLRYVQASPCNYALDIIPWGLGKCALDMGIDLVVIGLLCRPKCAHITGRPGVALLPDITCVGLLNYCKVPEGLCLLQGSSLACIGLQYAINSRP